MLLVVIRDVRAGVPSLGGFIESGGGAVDIVDDEFDISSARGHMMMMKVVVGAHCHLLTVFLGQSVAEEIPEWWCKGWKS